MNNYLDTATDLALKAGQLLRSFWGKLTDIKQKQYFWDLVTEADLASEALIIDALKKLYPEHRILSEETGFSSAHASDHLWLIDPLDGTTNFTHQYPMISVSIALFIRQEPVVGVVYNPIHQELFQAEHGQGATLNGKSIHVSSIEQLERGLLATGFAYDRKETQENNYAEFCHMTHLSQGVRRGGSAALDLAYVAAGRLDGYWERGLKPWDMAAGVVLVQEAGGKISSYENGPLDISSGRILATNEKIHMLLSHELQRVAKKPIP